MAFDPYQEAPPMMMGDEEMPPAAAPAPQQTAYAGGQNLADPSSGLTLDFLKRLGQRVLSDAMRDRATMTRWREKTAEHIKLYNSSYKDTLPDQPSITVMQLPYVRRGVKMFKSQMFPELYPVTGEIVIHKVESPSLEDVAARTTAHMNYQLVNEIVEYIPSHDRGMTQDLAEGVIFEVFWYDGTKDRPCQEICLADDVWIDYHAKIDDPSMPGVRVSWRRRYHQHQLEAEEDSGYYLGITAPVQYQDGDLQPLFPEGMSYTEEGAPIGGGGQDSSSDEDPVKQEADDHIGHDKPVDDPNGPRKVIEQDRMLKLPGERRQRAVTVCVDLATGNVLRLALREKEDPKDRRRHRREVELWQAEVDSQMAMFEEASMMHGQASQAWARAQPMVDPATGAQILMDPETGMEAAEPGQPPMQPQPPPQPDPPKRVPWDRWVKYDCEPNPEGALGHGVAHDVAGHNVLANKIATRAVTALTASLLPTGIMSRQSRFGRGEMQMKIGFYAESPLSPAQVQAGAGLYTHQFPAPDPQWSRVIETADQSAQQVTAFDIAMGAPGKSGETATESENRNSNATRNMSLVSQRFNRARARSLWNLAYINSLTLPDSGVRIYASLDQGADREEIIVTREDYEVILDELTVTFTCDPNMESQAVQERRALKAFDTVMNIVNTTMGQGGPPLIDPNAAIGLVRMVGANVFKAMKLPKRFQQALLEAEMPQAQPPGGPNAEEGGGPGGPPGPEMEQGGGGEPPPDAGGEAPPGLAGG